MYVYIYIYTNRLELDDIYVYVYTYIYIYIYIYIYVSIIIPTWQRNSSCLSWTFIRYLGGLALLKSNFYHYFIYPYMKNINELDRMDSRNIFYDWVDLNVEKRTNYKFCSNLLPLDILKWFFPPSSLVWARFWSNFD